MKRFATWIVLAALSALALGALAGCSGSPSASSGSASKPPAAIDVTQQDQGSTKSMQIGQQLKVGLQANPTTGYTWALDGNLPPQLTQSGEPTYTATSGVIGGGGMQVWTFTATSPGQGTLNMKYWRSFEASTPPVKTYSINVNVQ